jgi:hypothetical protein
LFSSTFLALLAVLHVLKPEFDPSWRMISEYAIGPYGSLMVLAFFCWGASVLSLLIALRTSLRGVGGIVAGVWFSLIALALLGAGIFTTSPITDLQPTLTNKMHQICGTVVIFTFPIAASILTKNLRKNQAWSALHDALRRDKWIPWLGLLTFFGAIVVFRLLNPHAGRSGPFMLIGWPNRFLVVTYHVWLQLVASYVRKTR